MLHNNLPFFLGYQLLAEQKYAALKQAVEAAGFFAPHVIGEHDGDHLVCTSKYQEGQGYTGRILFVSEAGGRWYFATPHPYHYSVLDSSRINEAVLAFLAEGPSRYEEVVQISYEEYEQALGRG